jgi:hypothetical protein
MEVGRQQYTTLWQQALSFASNSGL